MKYISWSQIGRLKISKSAIFYKTIHKSSMLLLLRSHFSHPTLCDPIDGTLPSSPIPGILQARTMEWVAISFSNAWKWSRSIVSNLQQPHGLQPCRLLHPWDFPGRSIGVGCHCLLQNPAYFISIISWVQFSRSVVSDSLWPMNGNMPGLPVHHQLPEFTETHIHWVSDAIQASHSLSSPFPPTFSLSQKKCFFKWVSSLHQVAKVLEFQLQHQSFQWIFRTDFL